MKGESVLVYRMEILLKSELWLDYKSIMYERVTLDYKDV